MTQKNKTDTKDNFKLDKGRVVYFFLKHKLFELFILALIIVAIVFIDNLGILYTQLVHGEEYIYNERVCAEIESLPPYSSTPEGYGHYICDWFDGAIIGVTGLIGIITAIWLLLVFIKWNVRKAIVSAYNEKAEYKAEDYAHYVKIKWETEHPKQDSFWYSDDYVTSIMESWKIPG